MNRKSDIKFLVMMENTDLGKLVMQVCDVACKAGDFIRSYIKKDNCYKIDIKSEHNYVTEVDKQTECLIIRELSLILPEAGFIAEEGTVSKTDKDLMWVIDPLDGTTNFIHGFPVFAVSIALLRKNEILLGVVYEVNKDECFYAWKEGGAYLNGNPIKVSSCSNIHDSIIITGFVHNEYSKMNINAIFGLFRQMCLETSGVRRLGSAATNLAYIAAGRADGFYESGLSSWDVAAGIILIKEAKGKVTDFDCGDNCIFGREIIASNGLIHDEISGRIVTGCSLYKD